MSIYAKIGSGNLWQFVANRVVKSRMWCRRFYNFFLLIFFRHYVNVCIKKIFLLMGEKVIGQLSFGNIHPPCYMLPCYWLTYALLPCRMLIILMPVIRVSTLRVVIGQPCEILSCACSVLAWFGIALLTIVNKASTFTALSLCHTYLFIYIFFSKNKIKSLLIVTRIINIVARE